MLTYRVTYAHENANAQNEKERHGFAMQELQVDHEITTEADLVEIARNIGREHGYTKVAVMKTELKEESVDPPSLADQIITGEVV